MILIGKPNWGEKHEQQTPEGSQIYSMQLGDKILDRKELVEHNGGCKLSRTAAQIALYAPIEMQK